jgi:2-polyprenyl-3-methyl-5-hydroxy-6-metoxy-1,4-benzoquinol methylase
VIGVDLDREKIALAERLTASVPNLSFQAEDIAAVADQLPPLDAVTILDVFYLVPFEIQARLLAICASRLAPGGVIVLKDMAEGPRWKAALNWLEETLAVRVLKITETSDPSARFYFRPRAEWIALLEGLGLRVTVQPLDRGYYHPHIAFIATKV